MKTLSQFFLTVVLFSAILISCKNSHPGAAGSPGTYDLKVLPEQTTLKLSDLGAKEVRYIPLETTEKSVISRIQKIIRGKNFFLTQSFTDIKMFRYDGSFVTKIGTPGRGPDEFTVAHDVDINPESQTIYLLDGWQQKFLVYSGNGELIRTFKYPVRAAVNFRFTEDGILCYNLNNMGDIETSFILIDTTGQIIKSFPNKYPWTRKFPTLGYQSENIFYRFNNRLIKKEIYCDTLYFYNNKDFEPYSVIDIGDRRITPDVRTETDAKIIMQNYINPMNLFEFGDYIYYEFFASRYDKPEGLSFIGSKDGRLRVLFDPEKELINDLDGGPEIWPRSAWDDRTLVSWIDAINLKSTIASDNFRSSSPKYPEKKKELERLAKNLEETDNPVLILIKFK